MSILNKILLIGQMQIDDKQHLYLEYVSGGYIHNLWPVWKASYSQHKMQMQISKDQNLYVGILLSCSISGMVLQPWLSQMRWISHHL